MKAPLSNAARYFAEQTAQKLLAGRKGHGGAPISYRVFRHAQIAALAGMAFEAGRRHEQCKNSP